MAVVAAGRGGDGGTAAVAAGEPSASRGGGRGAAVVGDAPWGLQGPFPRGRVR